MPRTKGTKGTKGAGPALCRTRQTSSCLRELVLLGRGRATLHRPSRVAHPGFKRLLALHVLSLASPCLRFVPCARSLTQARAMTGLFQLGASPALLRMQDDA